MDAIDTAHLGDNLPKVLKGKGLRKLAEREGFEPTVGISPRTLSRRVP